MRRLPIFLLVDVSESMIGDSLYQLEEGIGAIARTLRQDPYALETAFLSVIVFAGKARTLMPLTELIAFQPPELPVGGGTALGAALDHLMNEIDRGVARTTPDRKGDWRPMVFLLTDGHPTDRVEPAITRWNARYRTGANLIAVSIGGGADHALLRRLTDEVVVFNDAAPDAFARFIKWISMSVSTQSRSVAASDTGKVNLAKADADLIARPSEHGGPQAEGGIDERFAVFVGKCEHSRRPYLIKYERQADAAATKDARLAELFGARKYHLSTAVPVKNSYFELSDGAPTGQSIDSGQLIGQPACPHCQAPYGLAICACGGVHCVDGAGEHVCPWCDTRATYGAVEGGAGPSVNRGRG